MGTDIKYFLIGFGVASIVFIIGFLIYDHYTFTPKIYETRQKIAIDDDFIIPRGTFLQYEHTMPEGYDELTIRIRIGGGYVKELLKEVDYKEYLKSNDSRYYWLDPDD